MASKRRVRAVLDLRIKSQPLLLGGRFFPKDPFTKVAEFSCVNDLLQFSCCSRATRTAVLFPATARVLLKRSLVDSADFERCLIAAAFLSRQSRPFLLALLAFMSERSSQEWQLREAFLNCLQLAQITSVFPADNALYAMTDAWSMSRTMAAAWLNDIRALQNLWDARLLEPNATFQTARPKNSRILSFVCRSVTPICRTSDAHCMQLLIAKGSEPRADIRQPGANAPVRVLHEAAPRCGPEALRILLASGAEADVNELGDKRACLHWMFSPGPTQILGFRFPLPENLRNRIADSWKCSVDVLLQAGADPTLTAMARWFLSISGVCNAREVETFAATGARVDSAWRVHQAAVCRCIETQAIHRVWSDVGIVEICDRAQPREAWRRSGCVTRHHQHHRRTNLELSAQNFEKAVSVCEKSELEMMSFGR